MRKDGEAGEGDAGDADADAPPSLPPSPKYDITSRLAPFLDRHLVLPLVEFLDARGVYSGGVALSAAAPAPAADAGGGADAPPAALDPTGLLAAKLSLLEETAMVDLAADVWVRLHPSATELPPAMVARREAVVANLQALEAECAPLLAVLQDRERTAALLADDNLTPAFLEEHCGVPAAVTTDTLLRFAKAQFDAGLYGPAAEILAAHRTLTAGESGEGSAERALSALWGKLAAGILMQQWDEAFKDVNLLREAVDAADGVPPVKLLQRRTWLLHWALFVFFNHADGPNAFVDLVFQERYQSVIQTTCPHLLRYVVAAVLLNRRRRTYIQDVVRLVQQEAYKYSDPLTSLVDVLFGTCDFHRALELLGECATLFESDAFLIAHRAEFLENARLLLFESYCRVHRRVDLAEIEGPLDLSGREAERWIVNLVRNARIDARIDSARNHLLVAAPQPSMYQRIIEKSKGLAFRSSTLAANIMEQARASSSS